MATVAAFDERTDYAAGHVAETECTDLLSGLGASY